MLTTLRDFFFAHEWRGRSYLVSPAVDFACAGGLALLSLALLMVFVPPAGESYEGRRFVVMAVLADLVFVINDPHFMASYLLLYRGYGERLRRLRGQHRELWVRTLIAGVIAPEVMLVYFAYALIAQRAEFFSAAMVVMLLIVGWHYVKQSFGVFMMLSALKKVSYLPWERRLLLINCYAFWLFTSLLLCSVGSTPEAEARHVAPRFELGITYRLPGLHIPPMLMHLVGGATLLLGLASVVVIVWRRRAPLFSFSALTGYLSMYYLLGLAFIHPLWLVLYPVFHSLQYLLFVYAYKRGERAERLSEATEETDRLRAKRGVFRFGAAAFWLGFICFAALPTWLENYFNPDDSFLFPMTATLVIFINVHHYFIDNAIWRRENGEVAQYLFQRG
jgi:hypothetical protein